MDLYYRFWDGLSKDMVTREKCIQLFNWWDVNGVPEFKHATMLEF